MHITTSPFISLWILRDLPQQKIPRELCDGGDPAIFLYFHVPIEKKLMGKITKKITKNKKKRMEERKRRDFYIRGGSILMCYPSVGNIAGLLPSCDPPSGEPTRVETSPIALQLSLSHS